MQGWRWPLGFVLLCGLTGTLATQASLTTQARALAAAPTVAAIRRQQRAGHGRHVRRHRGQRLRRRFEGDLRPGLGDERGDQLIHVDHRNESLRKRHGRGDGDQLQRRVCRRAERSIRRTTPRRAARGWASTATTTPTWARWTNSSNTASCMTAAARSSGPPGSSPKNAAKRRKVARRSAQTSMTAWSPWSPSSTGAHGRTAPTQLPHRSGRIDARSRNTSRASSRRSQRSSRRPRRDDPFEPINEPWGTTTPQYNGGEYADVIAKLLRLRGRLTFR